MLILSLASILLAQDSGEVKSQNEGKKPPMKNLDYLNKHARLHQELNRAQVAGNGDQILIALNKIEADRSSPFLFYYFYVEQGLEDLSKKEFKRIDQNKLGDSLRKNMPFYELALDIVAGNDDKLPETLSDEEAWGLVRFSYTMLSQYYFKAPDTILSFLKKKGAPAAYQQDLENSIAYHKKKRGEILKVKTKG